MTRARWLLLALAIALAALFLSSELRNYFGLAQLKLAHAQLVAWHEADPLRTATTYFLLYVALTGLSLPVAGIMMLAAGAIFGLVWGTVIALFACAFGATIAFLIARFLFRDVVESRFGKQLAVVNRGLERDGALYVFLLRFSSLFPFFMINALLALTRISTRTFFLTTLLGMSAGAIIFVNAGTELSRIESSGDVLSPRVAASLVLLGAFPLVARKIADWVRRRR